MCLMTFFYVFSVNENLNVSIPVFCATPNIKTEINFEKVDGLNDENVLVSPEVIHDYLMCIFECFHLNL